MGMEEHTCLHHIFPAHRPHLQRNKWEETVRKRWIGLFFFVFVDSAIENVEASSTIE
jgi:hypothetical protein